MKNLSSEDKIHHPFTAPKGYFEALPQQVQGRIKAKAPKAIWPIWALRLALPVLLLGLGIIWWAQGPANTDAPQPVAASKATEALLQEVSPQEMGNYLLEEDISEHEIYEVASIKNIELQSEEEEILEEIDLEDLL